MPMTDKWRSLCTNRAASKLLFADVSVLDLNEPTIRETVLAIATRLNLLVEIEL